MGRISALTELTSLASDDYLVVLDSSANIAKKITIANAFGITDFGWTATGESWTYASWTSGTRIGTITVPTDATTKYKAGDRIKITQTTGGTKYGIIVKVTSTVLTVFFPSGTTFNNEAITSPTYALAGVNPFGFPTDPTLWQLKYSSTSNASQGSPTANTWYNLGSTSIAIGIGIWELSYEANIYETVITGPSMYATLSTSNNSESDPEFTSRNYINTNASILNTVGRRKFVNLASATTYYLNAKVDAGSPTSINFYGSQGATIITAFCAYL